MSFGPVLIDKLKTMSWPPHVQIEDMSYSPVAAVQKFREEHYDKLILISATKRNRHPGQVYVFRPDGRLPPPEDIQSRVGEAVTGTISLDNLLIICQFFGALPPDVVVIEVEPVSEDWGVELTREVEAQIKKAIALIQREAELFSPAKPRLQ
jgi:hydrogenase maturation protease